LKRALKILGGLLVLVVLALSWPAYQIYEGLQKARSEDPLVWEDDIAALEESTRDLYAPGQAVVFIGSSSIRFWDTLAEDMAPIPVIQHGFGGAKLNDVVVYAPRLVNAYQPRAVVVFAGTNDINPEAHKAPEALLASYQEFVRIVRGDQPDVPILFVGITPSIQRWEVWHVAQRANALIRQWGEGQSGLHFIDTSKDLLSADGEPDSDNYIWDGLHLSDEGYAIWAGVIKPWLEQALPAFSDGHAR